jgi:hypothetical protein
MTKGSILWKVHWPLQRGGSMVFFVVWCGAMLTLCLQAYFQNRRCEERRRIEREMEDLRSHIVWLFVEDTLSLDEWREWLPVCRFADRRHRKFCNPNLSDEHASEYLVLIILLRLQKIEQ